MYFNGMNNGMMGGVMPNPVPTPRVGNWLPPEKYDMLQKDLNRFKLSVTEEDVARGQCNHYYENGSSALIPDADGSGGCCCAICGTKFNSHEYTADDVKAATQTILDILNITKIMYLSLDSQAARDYFQIIPFIEKIPGLYELAVNDFRKYEGVNQFTTNPGTINPFGMLATLMGGYTNPTMAPQPMMGQPMMGGMNPQMGQPMMGMNGQPMVNNMVNNQPMMGGMPQGGFNPMYSQPVQPQTAPQAPAGGYQPAPNGYSFNPMGAAAPQTQAPTVNTNMPVQPQTAPAADETVKVDGKFSK